MAIETHIHDGSAYRKVKQWHVHDGTAWRKLKSAYCHDGTAWRKVFQGLKYTDSGLATTIRPLYRGVYSGVYYNLYVNSVSNAVGKFTSPDLDTLDLPSLSVTWGSGSVGRYGAYIYTLDTYSTSTIVGVDIDGNGYNTIALPGSGSAYIFSDDTYLYCVRITDTGTGYSHQFYRYNGSWTSIGTYLIKYSSKANGDYHKIAWNGGKDGVVGLIKYSSTNINQTGIDTVNLKNGAYTFSDLSIPSGYETANINLFNIFKTSTKRHVQLVTSASSSIAILINNLNWNTVMSGTYKPIMVDEDTEYMFHGTTYAGAAKLQRLVLDGSGMTSSDLDTDLQFTNAMTDITIYYGTEKQLIINDTNLWYGPAT